MTPSLLLLAAATMNVPQPVATPFPLSSIRLMDGPFQNANRATAAYLLELEPARLLAGFRANSGLSPDAEIYGGWETGGLSGHSLGHYLTACSQEYARTGDVRFKSRVDEIVAGLVECQKARPDGFLCAFRFDRPSPDGRPAGFDRERLDAIWADVAAGKLRSGGFDLNGMWSPWYVHHKVFAGLLDAQALCGNTQALGVADKFADWAYNITKKLTPEQWQTMLGTEYGGLNESLAELYSRTTNPRHLELARKFYDNRVLEPLSKGEDNLAGKHSNTQIPKLIGLARLYELTGEEKDRKTAEFFWDRIVNHHSYAIGGNSNGEYLGPPDRLSDRISTNTAETCNTYNMLKLTRHVFSWDPQASKMDFYERAYLNHILASQNEEGMVTYFMPLATNSFRGYSNKFHDFTCCHGSGMENHTKHGDSAYFHDADRTLWLNLFLPTELDWKQAGIKLRQETGFPVDNQVAVTVTEGSKPFEMRVRHPGWAKGSIDFKVNGRTVLKSTQPGSYASVKRTWKKGDKLEFELPMSLRIEATPDNPKRVAILYGPVVLAADMGDAPNGRRGRGGIGAVEAGKIFRTPVLVTEDRPIDEWLKPVPGKPLVFQSRNAMRPEDLVFAPFHTMTNDRYGVYFDQFTPEEWAEKEAEYRAEESRIKDLEERTVDSMSIGQMQPERDHNLTQERTDVREQNDRGTRQPLVGGWMEFDMKVDASAANELIVTYWGNDRNRPDFEILVDGKRIAEDTLENRPMNRYYDVVYLLPEDATRGKDSVRVRFQPKPEKVGPTVGGARTARRKR
ncbi:MAG TPA: beta-L-arabinofuranosidase domain-containing protein [Fimbriimonas sp.]